MESNKTTDRVSVLINWRGGEAWSAITRMCVWARERNRKEKKERDVSHSGKCLCTLSQEVCQWTERSTCSTEGWGQRSTFPWKQLVQPVHTPVYVYMSSSAAPTHSFLSCRTLMVLCFTTSWSWWACYSILRHTRLVSQSVTARLTWRQKFTSTSEAAHNWCSAAKPLTADLITGGNMFCANKIKKVLFYRSISIINLIYWCSFVLFCFTQLFFSSNLSVMAHGCVIVTVNR